MQEAEVVTSASPSRPGEPAGRRGFLAFVIGTLVGAFPFLAGLAVLLDPLRRGDSQGKALRVTALDSLPDDGIPRQFPVIADRDDAWNRYQGEPIGAVYLVRNRGEERVRAFSATCPHLGCFVAYLAPKQRFECPCHKSSFDTSGQKIGKVSPRNMDELECQIRTVQDASKPGQSIKEVWVTYRKFKSGVDEQIVEA
jgi:menaquinol-cytochrome c reductase iron-sulfur subunit